MSVRCDLIKGANVSAKKIKIIIDGIETLCNAGETILTASKRAGVAARFADIVPVKRRRPCK